MNLNNRLSTHAGASSMGSTQKVLFSSSLLPHLPHLCFARELGSDFWPSPTTKISPRNCVARVWVDKMPREHCSQPLWGKRIGCGLSECFRNSVAGFHPSLATRTNRKFLTEYQKKKTYKFYKKMNYVQKRGHSWGMRGLRGIISLKYIYCKNKREPYKNHTTE